MLKVRNKINETFSNYLYPIKGLQGIKNNRKIGWINIILALISFVISMKVVIVTFPGFD
jgi:hypothetical protein